MDPGVRGRFYRSFQGTVRIMHAVVGGRDAGRHLLAVEGLVEEGGIGGGTSKNFNFNQVSFAAGAKNHFHTHTSDQILYVTSGRGYVATESEQLEITEGDAAFIPAGEKHWHGATDDSDFSHISLTAPGSQTEVFPK